MIGDGWPGPDCEVSVYNKKNIYNERFNSAVDKEFSFSTCQKIVV
jgi:hypothetical protein